jgi:hypothetical protein
MQPLFKALSEFESSLGQVTNLDAARMRNLMTVVDIDKVQEIPTLENYPKKTSKTQLSHLLALYKLVDVLHAIGGRSFGRNPLYSRRSRIGISESEKVSDHAERSTSRTLTALSQELADAGLGDHPLGVKNLSLLLGLDARGTYNDDADDLGSPNEAVPGPTPAGYATQRNQTAVQRAGRRDPSSLPFPWPQATLGTGASFFFFFFFFLCFCSQFPSGLA